MHKALAQSNVKGMLEIWAYIKVVEYTHLIQKAICFPFISFFF